MINFAGKISILAATVILLTGCEENMTTAYLLQHPTVLKKEVDHCQDKEAISALTRSSHCQMIFETAKEFMELANAQQMDPESFGQLILTTEMEGMKAKQEMLATEQMLNTLRMEKANAEKMRAAEEMLQQAQQLYQAKLEKAKVMLAVVGMTSPE
ncbi:MAG TPA: hypothetical protein VHZ76_09160 [Gammaproteobacteria bacterium]|nr:hypothetical protein [Gammaproteobacteria bacterium]